MKIILNQPVLDWEGKEIKEGEDTSPLTLRALFNTAMSSVLKDEILTAEQKNKAHQIGLKLYSSDEPDFTADDRTFIKERAEKCLLSPLACGRVLEALFPEPAKDSEVPVETPQETTP